MFSELKKCLEQTRFWKLAAIRWGVVAGISVSYSVPLLVLSTLGLSAEIVALCMAPIVLCTLYFAYLMIKFANEWAGEALTSSLILVAAISFLTTLFAVPLVLFFLVGGLMRRNLVGRNLMEVFDRASGGISPRPIH